MKKKTSSIGSGIAAFGRAIVLCVLIVLLAGMAIGVLVTRAVLVPCSSHAVFEFNDNSDDSLPMMLLRQFLKGGASPHE